MLGHGQCLHLSSQKETESLFMALITKCLKTGIKLLNNFFFLCVFKRAPFIQAPGRAWGITLLNMPTNFYKHIANIQSQNEYYNFTITIKPSSCSPGSEKLSYCFNCSCIPEPDVSSLSSNVLVWVSISACLTPLLKVCRHRVFSVKSSVTASFY